MTSIERTRVGQQSTVIVQMRRWMDASCFELIVEDLRVLLREFAGRAAQPTAVVIDSRTLRSIPESGARARYDGAKRRQGSKTHAVVDTLGHLLALHVTSADGQDRAQVGELARQIQEVTGEHVELAFVDQWYTEENAAAAAERHGIHLEVVKYTQGKRGFVFLPRRWMVERASAWAARFRRLARDYERLAKTLAALHFLAFTCIMLANLFRQLAGN